MPEDISLSPTESPRDLLDAGLVHRENLRLHVAPLAALPDALSIEQYDADNERFLRALSAMEEHPEPSEDAEGLHPELVRLDLKVSLLMDLVGELLSRQAGLPSPRPVRFNAKAIAWPADPGLPSQGLVALELYLHPSLPRPLHLFARVGDVEHTGDAVELVGVFVAMSDAVQDLVEKYIFRAHRRAVARQRSRAGS